MRIISRKKLSDFWQHNPQAEKPLRAWFYEASLARWQNPGDLKKFYGSVSFVGDRTVFNIAGNKFRLVVLIDYQRHGVLIRFIGTHKAYDKINVVEI